MVGTVLRGPARMPGATLASCARDVRAVAWAGGRTTLRLLARTAGAAVRLLGPPAVVVKITSGQLGAGAAALGSTGRSTVRGMAAAAPARSCEAALPADATAPRQARALLSAAVAEWELDDDLHQDAAMVVTELVANAVDHARSTSTLTVALGGHGLFIAVRDVCRCPAPRARPVDPTAPRGRGLQMIDALATSWGVTGHVDGKTVWAILPVP